MSKGFIAVYGTLRKGFGLNRYLEEDRAEFLGTKEIEGYKMYVFSPDHWSYPILSRTDKKSDKVEVELYKVHDNMSGKRAEDRIDSIEYDAGYYSEDIEIDGNPFKIYLQHDDELQRFHHVKSGNFTEYSKQYE
jgi:gamma-glutamylcyclotransferase (GGCT)/AIG2-like uncharacterized protein YtfP